MFPIECEKSESKTHCAHPIGVSGVFINDLTQQTTTSYKCCWCGLDDARETMVLPSMFVSHGQYIKVGIDYQHTWNK